MVFHTIRVILTPLFIFRHLSFCPLSAVDDNIDSPFFSFCRLVFRISFLLSKGDRAFLFSDRTMIQKSTNLSVTSVFSTLLM